MSNVLVTSDTWFNRPMIDDASVNVNGNNEFIITQWNNKVNAEDDIYVLGGFGISDLFSIVVKLNGNIHFLNNYFNEDEKMFMNNMKTMIDKSGDYVLQHRITFEDKQIKVLENNDAVLSYFPLEDWTGKQTGTFCFHGLNDEMNLNGHNISCSSYKWDAQPVDIEEIQKSIEEFKKNC